MVTEAKCEEVGRVWLLATQPDMASYAVLPTAHRELAVVSNQNRALIVRIDAQFIISRGGHPRLRSGPSFVPAFVKPSPHRGVDVIIQEEPHVAFAA